LPARLTLSRAQILAFRRHVGGLNRRLPPGPESLRRAAWAGLQDSMPRAALLSIHARVEGTTPSSWEDPALVQLWGPRFSTYVVPAVDLAVFALGTYPDDAKGQRKADELAAKLDTLLGGAKVRQEDAARELGVHPNHLRYSASTGRVVIRWDGARQPTMWTMPPPDLHPGEARLELARRYLHVFGPTTAESFAGWAGIGARHGVAAFEALRPELVPVRTPTGDRWNLAEDEPALRAAEPPAATRLLPSGDTYFLLHGVDRDLLLPDANHRNQLWTSRVWPGALLVEGEVVGTWRRAHRTMTIQTWRPLALPARHAVEAEAASLPLPDVGGQIDVRWADG
jgi:hypothetical protein